MKLMMYEQHKSMGDITINTKSSKPLYVACEYQAAFSDDVRIYNSSVKNNYSGCSKLEYRFADIRLFQFPLAC